MNEQINGTMRGSFHPDVPPQDLQSKINALRARFRNWRARRKYERAWRKSTPAQQVITIVEMLHSSPELARLFRDALYGKTREAGYSDRLAPPAPPPVQMAGFRSRRKPRRGSFTGDPAS